MGLLDKLFGGVVLPPTTRTRTSTGSAHRPAAPGAKGTHAVDRPANPMRQTPAKPKPEAAPSESAERLHPAAAPIKSADAAPAESVTGTSEAALTAEEILAELFAQPASEPAAAPASTETGGGSLLEAKGSMGSFVAEPIAEPTPAPAAPAAPVAAAPVKPAEPAPVVTAPAEPVSSEPAETPAPWSDVTQRKLDRYFARMRQAYPDGVIVRLNTGQKKLAERGAQLRRESGMEGRLDEFFALGEFTYRRSEGGRPSVVKTDRQQEGLLRDLHAAFPQGVPSVAAVQQADHRLYLNLRAAARRDQCTMTDYLKRHELSKKKECVL